MHKISQGLAKYNLLNVANKTINNQVYMRNLQNLTERNLLYIADILISSKINVYNLTILAEKIC